MSHFWHFAKRMLRYKWTLAVAGAFAVLSAAGLGAGLMSLGPMLGLILNDQGDSRQSLQQIAADHNASATLLTVPEWLVAALPSDPFHGVIWIVVGLAVLTIIGATANFCHQYLSMVVIAKTIGGIRRDCFRRVIHMPLGRILVRGPSDFVSRIIRDAAELQGGLIALTSKAAAQITKGLAAFMVALWFNWQLTLIALVVAPPLVFALRKIGKRIRRGTRGSLQAQEELLRISSEALRGISAVKASTGEREAAARFHRGNKRAIRQEMRVRLARSLAGPLVETLAIFAIGTLAIVAAKQIVEGDLAFSVFFLTIGALGVAGASFKPLTGLINEVQAASAPAERLMEILSEPLEVRRDEKNRSMPRHCQSVEFRDVTFWYEGSEEPAVRQVSLFVRHGEKVAIVGPNGCGKTTLLSMVPRLLCPQSGQVLIDDINIEQVNARSLRRQIGVVTQETVLFRGTVAENIAFGAGVHTMDRIVEAARRARADEFIRNLANGYDHVLVEGGSSLSGGQRQRLAIARAVLRDPSILILDEATSQIDSESEGMINAALAEFCEGRTSLIIAHRMSTVLMADRIVVMENGRIIDEGGHADLLTRCTLYQRLARSHLDQTRRQGRPEGEIEASEDASAPEAAEPNSAARPIPRG